MKRARSTHEGRKPTFGIKANLYFSAASFRSYSEFKISFILNSWVPSAVTFSVFFNEVRWRSNFLAFVSIVYSHNLMGT